MSVANTPRKQIYSPTGGGGVGPYTFNFKVLSSSDIAVYALYNGDSALSLIAPANYTVTLTNGGVNGGSVTLAVGLANGGDRLLIEGAIAAITQPTPYANLGSFNPERHEASYDRAAIIAQELNLTLTSALKIPQVDTTGTDVELPVASARALKALIFDTDGNVGVSVDDYVDQLADVTAQAVLASQWATKVTGLVAATDFSAKAWSIGGTGVTTTSGKGASKEWAITTGGAVDTTNYSAKEHAVGTTVTTGSSKDWATKTSAIVAATDYSAKEFAIGTQAATGGSAKSWAQTTGADVTGAAANSRSAKSWSQDVLTGATLGGSSKDWAQTTGGTVDGAGYAAKEHAVGTSVTTGSAKDWATKTSSTVIASNYSAKEWATGTQTRGASGGGSAKDWANYTGGVVDDTSYSAKYYSNLTAADVVTTHADVVLTHADVITTAASATAAAASAAAAAASASGISMRGSCRVCATGALTVTYANGVLGVGATLTNAGAQAAFAQDGVTVSVGERVLVPLQAAPAQNGMYTLTVAGSGATNWVLTRTTDYDEASEIVEGTATIIEEGTTNASHIYVMTHHGAITVGTTAIDFTALTANATSANTLTTPRAIYGNNFDGSAALNQIIASTYGGTGNGFFKISGPTTSEKTKTVRDASDTILELGGSYTPTGTWTSMTFVTPALGTVASGVLSACTTATQASGDNSTKLASTAYADASAKRPFRTTTAATTLIASDAGGVVQMTGGTDRTFDATAVATLGVNWSTEVWNDSTAIITLDPNGAETIDTLTSFKMYPGEHRRISVNAAGTAFLSGVIKGFQYTVTSSGSWMIPPGYKFFRNRIWSSGQSGAARSTTGNAGGGAGGVYSDFTVDASKFVAAGSTETLTVAGTAAGVSGNTAGNTANSSSVTVNGTTFTIGVQATAAGYGNAPVTIASASAASGGFTQAIYGSTYGGPIGGELGGAGGDVTAANAPEITLYTTTNALHGGGGGGGCSSTAGGVRTGGISLYGGNGGAGGANTGGNGTNGTAPGGGGGAAVQGGTSGSGAGGQIIVSGYI